MKVYVVCDLEGVERVDEATVTQTRERLTDLVF
jgi:hypothetical protein